MKKYAKPRNKKRLGRKKRETLKWRKLRAEARGMTVKKYMEYCAVRGDPLHAATKRYD